MVLTLADFSGHIWLVLVRQPVSSATRGANVGLLQFECPPADPSSLQKNGDNGGEVTNQKVALWPKRGQEPPQRGRRSPGRPAKYAQVNALLCNPLMFREICRGDETGLADVWTRKQETRQDGRREGIPKDQISFLPRASVAVFSPVDGDLEEFKGEKCNSMNPAPSRCRKGPLATFCHISMQTVTAFMTAVFISIPILKRLCFRTVCLPPLTFQEPLPCNAPRCIVPRLRLSQRI